MTGWSLISAPAPGHRLFSRPLGTNELGFYWDGIFNGTADSLQNLEIKVVDGQDEAICSDENIIKAWTSLKRRFPLLAAQTQERGKHMEFILQEQFLMQLRSQELYWGTVPSANAAQDFIDDVLASPRPLSNDLLARVYILRRSDNTRSLHIIFHIAHCITDGIAYTTICRAFLETLSSDYDQAIPPLEERLAMAISCEALLPSLQLSAPRYRWRRAIGFILFNIRMSKLKGGQTLPRNLTLSTFNTPARSRLTRCSIPADLSTLIIATCRKNRITFGNAYVILSQVAMARILYRRRLRGEISDEEWEHRKREPTYTMGPLNLRPYLNQDWYSKGGGGELCLAISFFVYTLPYLPLGSLLELGGRTSELVAGAPPFSALLSPERFFFRSKIVKQEAQRFLEHPLFVEIAISASMTRIERTKKVALQWVHQERTGNDGGNVADAAAIPPWTSAHGGSSIGNLDLVLPSNYPLPISNSLSPQSSIPNPHRAGYATFHSQSMSSEHLRTSRQLQVTPKLHLERSSVHLHCRPNELYLGASMSKSELHLYVFADANVYEDSIVREWLDEIRDATLWYLARPVSDTQQAAKL